MGSRRRSDSSSSSYSSSSSGDSDSVTDDERLLRQQKRAQAPSPHALYVLIALTVLVLLAAFALLYNNRTSTLASSQPVTPTSSSASARPSAATSASNVSPSSKPSSSANTSSSSSTALPGISRNGIGIGFIPDDARKMTMAQINAGLGVKSSYMGWYAQLPKSGQWDGSQLLDVIDDVKQSGAIFQPAVMPTNGWAGLTKSDNSQALAIASVMQKFTDEGIEVWLRFAHEINWYLTDGTYQGTKDNFKTAWAVIYDAVKDNSMVKMYFTPNVADLKTYQEFYPDDPSQVHVLGIDYYPKEGTDSFVATMKPLHDAYCLNSTTTFAIAETGLAFDATTEDKLKWLDSMTNATAHEQLPKLVGVTWFNYDKEQDFVLWDDTDESRNAETKSWFAANVQQT